MRRTMADADRGEEGAIAWLREVEGRLLYKRDDPDGPDGWVAVVKTPAAGERKAQVILGFGDSATAAVRTARQAFDEACRRPPATIH